MEEPTYKLLYIAYACEPGRGSEWGLGWHYVSDLARTQPVWLITHEENKAGLNDYLRSHHEGFPIYPTYVRLPKVLEWMRRSWYSIFNIYYYLWQFAAAREARRVHREVGLDLVQHVSLFRWWMHSAGATLAKEGVGFIFGPVGGGDTLPRKLSRQVSLQTRAHDLARWLAKTLWRHDPLLKKCIRNADVLIAGIPSCEEWFRHYGGTNIREQCSAIAGAPELAAAALEARAGRPDGQPFTFVSCGGLSYFRGVDLAVKAFAKADIPNSRYIHLCDGPMRRSIEKLAVRLGVADRVILTGDMPHIDCVRNVAMADVCVHTVLRDSQGAMVEALLAGVPVITLDHLTPAMLITDNCGKKIPIDDWTTVDEIVSALADTMREWHRQPQLMQQMSVAAKTRGAQFTAEAKSRQYREHHLAALKARRCRLTRLAVSSDVVETRQVLGGVRQ